ncbi:MAG TPA: formate/nitrite transporter family protein [Bacillota bacterium]|nr:formate/nitrite transporter family protein [Bacillota bacterium]
MADKCQFLKTYSTGNGSVVYCELAAFNQPVSSDFLTKIGCTAEMRKECPGGTELDARLSAANPPVTPIISYTPPPDLAKTMVGVAEKKANTGMPSLMWLAILAGAYIALGAIMFTIITNDLATFIGDGLTRLIGGISFSIGLILVILAGAELFTGNNLIFTGYLEKKVTGKQVLSNWFWVYLFNFVGSLIVVFLFYYSGIWKANGGAIGVRAVSIAASKASLPWVEALFRGIFCNWLVCLAVWLSNASRDVISKILSIMIPIAAFVAAGFEHSIANMYFIPMGLALKNHPALAGLLNPAAIEGLTLRGFFLNNLIPVTIGNLIGGVLFVATVYWTVYLRPASAVKKAAAKSGA